MPVVAIVSLIIVAVLVLALAACSTSDDPYSRIPNGPLAPATLHAVTFATDGPALVEQLQKDGYALLPLAPNYEAAIRVQSIQLQVRRNSC